MSCAFADGDQVFIRVKANFTHAGEMMGVPATGRRVTVVEHDAFRIVDGKITEYWSVPDMLSMMQQIGAIPPAGIKRPMSAAPLRVCLLALAVALFLLACGEVRPTPGPREAALWERAEQPQCSHQ